MELNAYILKEFHNKLRMHFKELEKQVHTKLRRREEIKMRAEINILLIELKSSMKNWFFEKVNQIDKWLAR